jgi:hypothetical protein
MSGVLTYWVRDGVDRFRSIKLTILEDLDRLYTGTGDQRRRRLLRILEEARAQNARLSHGDLAMIMLVSRATIKRDVSSLRMRGVEVPVGGIVRPGPEGSHG